MNFDDTIITFLFAFTMYEAFSPEAMKHWQPHHECHAAVEPILCHDTAFQVTGVMPADWHTLTGISPNSW